MAKRGWNGDRRDEGTERRCCDTNMNINTEAYIVDVRGKNGPIVIKHQYPRTHVEHKRHELVQQP